MDNKDLIVTENEGLLTKIKKWFKGIFGKKNISKIKEPASNLEFETQENNQHIDYDTLEQQNVQIKYNFSTQTVSKQKIEKAQRDLDKGLIGIEELYQMSDEELTELSQLYDSQINDTVSKLNEIEYNIEGYKRKIAKIQAQNQ